jgi:hypothetical protein
MKTTLRPHWPLAWLFCILFFSEPAWAYIDPSAAIIFFQFLIGGILGALLTIRMYWARIKAWFRRTPSSDQDEQSE